jgi:hypothetical protein
VQLRLPASYSFFLLLLFPYSMSRTMTPFSVEGEVNKGFMRLRYKGHAGNALAPDAEERRSQLRKAAGRSKHPLIRGYLNGETCMEQSMRPLIGRRPGEVKHLSNRRKRNRKRCPE